MDDQPQENSRIRHAIKRLSNVLNCGASTATTRLRRQKSTTLDSIGNLPDKNAVPVRSALRGSRWPAIPERRVSFYDLLPCPNLGPSFAFVVHFGTESVERRGGLLLPAITDDDRNTDGHLREVEYNNKEQSATSPANSQPMARHDSPVEPDSLQRSKSMRGSRTPGSLPSNAERRRSCMDFTRAMMQEVHAQQSSPITQEQISTADRLDNISHAFKAHVDRSLSSMQGHDKRGRAYVHESLVEMQEALTQAMVDTTTTEPEPASTNEDEDEAGRSHTRVGSDDQSEKGLLFEPALMPSPLRVNPRHLRKDSTAFQ